jgi:hypothetical protein
MTVWPDADAAAYRFPKPPKPKTIEELLEEAYALYENEDQSYAYKAGFFYGLIQLLEFEITLLKLRNESLDRLTQQSTKGDKGGDRKGKESQATSQT